jgi:hypothetical protein
MHHMNVTTEHDVVCHDHTIANFAVVRDMRASHKIAIATDGSDAIFFFGRSVYGDGFP